MPSYAAAVRVAIINHLKKCCDLMLSFDGGKLGKKKFYSVHATTPNHQSFCLDLDDVTRLSQTGEYIFELLKKVCNLTLLIFLSSANRWSGVTSDNAANCSKARRLLAEYNPRILNMADACHNLHNACKDICNLPEFKEVLFLSCHGFSS